MGSWTHDANQINITTFSFDGRGGGEKLDLSDFSLNSKYVVSSQEETSIHTKKYECCPEPYMHVDWRFQVRGEQPGGDQHPHQEVRVLPRAIHARRLEVRRWLAALLVQPLNVLVRFQVH